MSFLSKSVVLRIPVARAALERLAREGELSAVELFPDMTTREKQTWCYKFLDRLSAKGVIEKVGLRGPARRYVLRVPREQVDSLSREDIAELLVKTPSSSEANDSPPEESEPSVGEPPGGKDGVDAVALLVERLGQMTTAVVAMHDKVEALHASTEALAKKVAFIGGRVHEVESSLRRHEERDLKLLSSLGDVTEALGEPVMLKPDLHVELKNKLDLIALKVDEASSRPVVVRRSVEDMEDQRRWTMLSVKAVTEDLRKEVFAVTQHLSKAPTQAELAALGQSIAKRIDDADARVELLSEQVAHSPGVADVRNDLEAISKVISRVPSSATLESMSARLSALEAKVDEVGERCNSALEGFDARHEQLASSVVDQSEKNNEKLAAVVKLYFDLIDKRLAEFGEGAGQGIASGFDKMGKMVGNAFDKLEGEILETLDKEHETLVRAVRFVKQYAPDPKEVSARTLPMSILALDQRVKKENGK